MNPVVSRAARAPAGWGAVDESAQATAARANAPRTNENTRDCEDMERSVMRTRSIYFDLAQ